jgi:hypothetical protein
LLSGGPRLSAKKRDEYMMKALSYYKSCLLSIEGMDFN